MTELKDLHMIGPSARPDTGAFFILSSEQELIIVNPEYCSVMTLKKAIHYKDIRYVYDINEAGRCYYSVLVMQYQQTDQEQRQEPSPLPLKKSNLHN